MIFWTRLERGHPFPGLVIRGESPPPPPSNNMGGTYPSPPLFLPYCEKSAIPANYRDLLRKMKYLTRYQCLSDTSATVFHDLMRESRQVPHCARGMGSQK